MAGVYIYLKHPEKNPRSEDTSVKQKIAVHN